MDDRVARAIAEARGIAIPFGFYWAMLMGAAAAASVWRNPDQPYYWGNMVAFAIVGYVLILGVIFLVHLFHKPPRT